jgi:hypothetical protein
MKELVLGIRRHLRRCLRCLCLIRLSKNFGFAPGETPAACSPAGNKKPGVERRARPLFAGRNCSLLDRFLSGIRNQPHLKVWKPGNRSSTATHSPAMDPSIAGI